MSALTTLTLSTNACELDEFFKDIFFPKLQRLCIGAQKVSEANYSLIRKNTHIRELVINVKIETPYPTPIEPLGHFPNLVSYHGSDELMIEVLPGSCVSEIRIKWNVDTATSLPFKCLGALSLGKMTIDGDCDNLFTLCDALHYASQNNTLTYCEYNLSDEGYNPYVRGEYNAPRIMKVRSQQL